MLKRGVFLVSCILLMGAFDACVDQCGPFTQRFFVLEGMSMQELEVVGDGLEPIDTSAVNFGDLVLRVRMEEVTYVASRESTMESPPSLRYFGLGSAAMACSPPEDKPQHELTGIQAFATDPIEFDAVYPANTDISEFFKMGFFHIEDDLQEYVDTEFGIYAYQDLMFRIDDHLESPYEGSFRIKLTFADGHEVDVTSKSIAVF